MADLNENNPGQSAEALAKAGYKKTKVGWIPEEWEEMKIAQIATVGNGTTPSESNPEYWENGSIAWLPTGKVNDRVIELSETFITQKALDETSLKVLPARTILLAMIGQGKTRGMVALTKIKATVNQNFSYIVPNIERVDHLYLFNRLSFDYYKLRGSGRGGGQESLNTRIVKNFKIPLPPLPEQRAIARILSTWDAAIDKLGQLIAKKQALKKGLMQQLLSGRVRFPEFVPPGGTRYKETKVGVVPEDWEVVKAGEIFERVSKKGQSGELLAVTQEEGVIPRSHLERRVVMPSGSTEGYKLVEPGNFIISLRSFQGGLEYSAYRGLVSPAYNIITYNPNSVSSTFFRYYFKSYCFIERLSSAVIGIRDGKQISYPDFKRQLIPLPGYKEQKAIGAFLEKADQEIKNLENQRVNLETQKKGLMQQLLTGAVRVKEGIANESFIDENS
ncbi:restriction endonuclease subunit S [Phaeodactylibacter xiamenensis]|uniref:restriction endonuclease subunit S n=1 Tax=Phaeodactylibacter xiamenensis TaxID=1524460 RepID=UPI0024A848BE|nr:restriction endonuclease subunit S [Phaeodactylibacter xiamenensis]